MEIKINLDLQAIISAATSAERLQPIIDKAVAEAVKDAVQSATGYRSAFREALTKQLTEAMPHGIGIDDVAKFQLMANQAVSEAVRGANAATIKAAIARGLQDVVPDVPERVKLSDLLEKAREGFHKDPHQGFWARMELTDYGYGHIYLDSDEDCRSKHQARTRIDLTKEGEVYAMKLDGEELKPMCMPTVIGHWEGLLLAMYVGRTRIEIDMGDDDVEYAAHPKED